MPKRVKDSMFIVGLGAVLGGLAGLGLSFTALSPLVVGGIIGSMLAVLPTAIAIVASTFDLHTDEMDDDRKSAVIYFGTLTAISVGIGVGLAAAATAIFPGAMLGMQSAALIGAAIEAIVPIIAIPVMNGIIVPVAEKVNEHIISPIVEKLFSSKEEGYKPV
ncbi:hypothetical protein [Candidatus Wolbachia massiliensis]|uniref:Uncharacterized protein n=1 Tax=Candidatus Wolbachia massiliensis TaxID=1845000 RepID=A0A7M3U243_9RICK|nr:hypothetical protein [Candidatus Wolbachia massiliensis]QOD38478.1 hypothetical protein ID128_01015 [Candidatus Wolbachia massiliensis]